jgi:hypothetical protein
MAVAGASREARIASSASRAPATRAESSCPVAVTVKTFSRCRSTLTPRFCRTAPVGDDRVARRRAFLRLDANHAAPTESHPGATSDSSKRGRATAIPAAGECRPASSAWPARSASPSPEGVETEQQLERLRDLGCTNVQGYLFARPGAAAVIEPLLDFQLCAPARWPDRPGHGLLAPEEAVHPVFPRGATHAPRRSARKHAPRTERGRNRNGRASGA